MVRSELVSRSAQPCWNILPGNMRNQIFDAQPAFAPDKPPSRQNQFGGTVGGPIRKNRVFFYAGFDQNLLDVPAVVQFANGATTVIPQQKDYDRKDKALVEHAAQKLNDMGSFCSLILDFGI